MELKNLVLMELSYFMLVIFAFVESSGTSRSVPYIIPMVIGRTFDLSKSSVGYDIFDQDSIKLKTTKNYLTTSKFKIVKTKKDVRDVLDISGHLSLQVMAGQVNIKGEGKYLKESADSSNIVEVLAKVTFRTITESIANVPKLRPGWNNDPIGQHYVRGITYGGYLIASLKFEAKNSQHKKDIEAKISATIREGTASVGIKGQFKLLAESVEDTSTLTISYIATAPLATEATDIDSLVKEIKDFPDLIKSSSAGGRGDPIEAHLIPLSQLDLENEKLKFLVNSATQTSLIELNLEFFDLVGTMNAITSFTETREYSLLTAEVNEKLNVFYDRVFGIFKLFNKVIAKIDLQKPESQFDNAFIAYREGKHQLPGKFKREFDELILDKENLFRFPEIPAYRRNGTLFVQANNSYTPVAQACKVKQELKYNRMEIENIKTQLSGTNDILVVHIESQACNPELFLGLYTVCKSGGESTSIKVNGEEFSLKQRGHNIVVLNPDTGVVAERRAFDTHVDGPSAAMRSFLKSLPERRLVLVGIQYSGEKLTNEAIASLQSLGGHDIPKDSRTSYALIGWTGPGRLDAVTQVQTKKLYGSSIIAKAIPQGVL